MSNKSTPGKLIPSLCIELIAGVDSVITRLDPCLNSNEDTTLEKNDFQENMRYTVTLRDTGGKLRPAKFYVMRRYNDAMIVRLTEREGILRKVAYADVLKIVKSSSVPVQDRYFIPEAILNEKNWKDRTEIQHYSSAPHMGK